jgi:hypothetical protein
MVWFSLHELVLNRNPSAASLILFGAIYIVLSAVILYSAKRLCDQRLGAKLTKPR